MKKVCKRRLFFVIITAVVCFALWWTGRLWWNCIEGQSHVSPDYEKEDISVLLGKTVTSEDYDFLFVQTGLNKSAVDCLVAQDRQQELLALQERFFAPVEIECRANTVLTREERIVEDNANSVIERIPHVETGDILITFNCHALGWRNGHAALVTDGEKRLVLEAGQLGSLSQVISMEHWETYPSFVLLRLKDVSAEQRAAIGARALECLEGIPYRLEAGIFERAKGESENYLIPAGVSPRSTHCAHLVWSAYITSGYDLDSDGGLIVTPRDIFESNLLEVIQIYGMEENSAD